MTDNLDISVVFATHNRADDVEKTLESMARLDRDGLAVEFVVVDNNSTDPTREVVQSHAGRLPVRYLFEKRPGKNCALNRALDEVALGKIVVFTDDDVEPGADWLKVIASTCERWKDDNVFGGRIELILPDIKPPGWKYFRTTPGLAFGRHDYGPEERAYEEKRYPVGANFWIRRSVLADGRRFNESVGPRPKNRLMGSETHFIRQLVEDGNRIIYVPGALVGHRVQAENFTVSGIRRRAFRLGRSGPHFRLCLLPLMERHPWLWFIRRMLAVCRYLLMYPCSLFSFSKDRRVYRRVMAVWGIAYNVESIRVGWEYRR